MFKKFATFSLLLLGSFLYSEATINLPFYKETEHFKAYCLQKDIEATDNVLRDLEQYYGKCSLDFRYKPSSIEKVRLYLYPDIQTFHSTLREETLSQWKVSKFSSEDNSVSLVSPRNPGRVHTEETTVKSARFSLGLYFIYNKCPLSSPWLACGLALFESKVYSKELLKQHLLNSAGGVVMPSCSQIDEQITKGNFTSRAYPISAYAYVEFLVNKWDWEKAVALLENYANFESILQTSEEEFQKKCIQYYQKELIGY